MLALDYSLFQCAATVVLVLAEFSFVRKTILFVDMEIGK